MKRGRLYWKNVRTNSSSKVSLSIPLEEKEFSLEDEMIMVNFRKSKRKNNIEILIG